MKFSRRATLAFFLFWLAIPIFPQTNDTLPAGGDETTVDIRQERTNRIKADVLQEIPTFPRKDQAYFYSRLGETIWEYDRKEGLYWLTKGVELAIGPPAAEYKDDDEKLTGLWNLLHSVIKRDEALSNKIIAKIREIKIDESKDADNTYVLIAEQLLSRKGDEKLAFELAMISLKGKKPAISFHSPRLLLALKAKNESQYNIYFSKLIEAVQKNGNVGKAVAYLFNDDFPDTYSKIWRNRLTDAEVKMFLELMLPEIQKDAERLSRKKRDDCVWIKAYGLEYLDDYKRLLPAKVSIIEQAITVCENSNIESWKKPNFYKKRKSLKTAQELLNLAKEIGDKKLQANYLKTAAQSASREKNYRLANSILDGINQELRDRFWVSVKINTNSSLIAELLKTYDSEDADEVIKSLNDAPPSLRPFIITNALSAVWRFKPEQKEFALYLMNQARADFNRMDKYFADPPDYFSTNVTQLNRLTDFYIKLGFYDEAASSHEDSVKNFNRLIGTLPAEYKEKPQPPLAWSFSSFAFQSSRENTEFFHQNFDRIYENTGKIVVPRTRINERFWLLRKNLEKTFSDKKEIPGIPNRIN